MKTIVTFFLMLTIAQFAMAQELVEGIGKFKIHKASIRLIDSLAKEMGGMGNITSSNDEVEASRAREDGDYRFYEVLCDTNNMGHDLSSNPVYAVSYPHTRVFYLTYYEIAGITINDIHIMFYKDTLISFTSNCRIEMEQALDLKYGKGELTEQEKDVHCSYVNGNGEVTYKEKKYTKVWPGKNVTCTSELEEYYDSNCKQQTIFIFILKDKAIVAKINDFTRKSRERYELREKAKQKSKLSEF
jgi:hypothetical protein